MAWDFSIDPAFQEQLVRDHDLWAAHLGPELGGLPSAHLIPRIDAARVKSADALELPVGDR